MISTIEGKVVAITGASSGIGRATAFVLAERGARVVLGARRTDQLREIADRITEAGGNATYVSTDVTKREDLHGLVDLARETYGRLDVLVSNAGIAPTSLLDDLRVDDWDAMVDVNIRGFLNGIGAALPVFREQGGGHFVTVVSTAGLRVSPTMAVYAGTKNAVRTIMEGLRQEGGPTLRVTEVSPGFVQTDLVGSMPDESVRAQIQRQMDEIAIAPEAVARAIAFAIEQPPDVEVGSIVVRPTAQG